MEGEETTSVHEQRSDSLIFVLLCSYVGDCRAFLKKQGEKEAENYDGGQRVGLRHARVTVVQVSESSRILSTTQSTVSVRARPGQSNWTTRTQFLRSSNPQNLNKR